MINTELNELNKLIHFDHKLRILFLKSSIKLKKDYKNKMSKKRVNNQNVILSYIHWNIDKKFEYKKPKDYETELESFKTEKEKQEYKKYWIAMSPYEIREKDYIVTAQNNELYITLLNLDVNFNLSRVKTILDNLVKLDIIEYTPKKSFYSKKNKREAVRNRVKRHAIIKEYEWSILFDDSKIGYRVFNELKNIANQKHKTVYPNTVYLQGYNKHANRTKKVKMYNVTARHEKRDTQETTDKFKIEITYYNKFFKTNDIKINNLTYQKKIFTLIKDSVEKDFKKIFDYLSREVKTMLKRHFNASNEQDLFSEIMRQDRVKQSFEYRLQKLELNQKEILEFKKDISERMSNIERAIQPNTNNS